MADSLDFLADFAPNAGKVPSLEPLSPAQVPTARQPPQLAGFNYHELVSAAPVGLLDALEQPTLNKDAARLAHGCKFATEHVQQYLANDNYATARSAPSTFAGYATQPPTGQQAQDTRPDAAPQNADALRQQHCLSGAEAPRISAAQLSGGNSHSGQQAFGRPSETQQSAGAAPIRQRSKTFGGAMAAAGEERRCSNNRADESNASNVASGSAAADGTAATRGRPEHSTAESGQSGGPAPSGHQAATSLDHQGPQSQQEQQQSELQQQQLLQQQQEQLQMQQTFLQAVMEAAGAAADVTVALGGAAAVGQGQGAPAAAGTTGGSRGGAAAQPTGGAAAGAGGSKSSKLPSDIPDRPLTAAEAKDAAEAVEIILAANQRGEIPHIRFHNNNLAPTTESDAAAGGSNAPKPSGPARAGGNSYGPTNTARAAANVITQLTKRALAAHAAGQPFAINQALKQAMDGLQSRRDGTHDGGGLGGAQKTKFVMEAFQTLSEQLKNTGIDPAALLSGAMGSLQPPPAAAAGQGPAPAAGPAGPGALPPCPLPGPAGPATDGGLAPAIGTGLVGFFGANGFVHLPLAQHQHHLSAAAAAAPGAGGPEQTVPADILDLAFSQFVADAEMGRRSGTLSPMVGAGAGFDPAMYNPNSMLSPVLPAPATRPTSMGAAAAVAAAAAAGEVRYERTNGSVTMIDAWIVSEEPGAAAAGPAIAAASSGGSGAAAVGSKRGTISGVIPACEEATTATGGGAGGSASAFAGHAAAGTPPRTSGSAGGGGRRTTTGSDALDALAEEAGGGGHRLSNAMSIIMRQASGAGGVAFMDMLTSNDLFLDSGDPLLMLAEGGSGTATAAAAAAADRLLQNMDFAHGQGPPGQGAPPSAAAHGTAAPAATASGSAAPTNAPTTSLPHPPPHGQHPQPSGFGFLDAQHSGTVGPPATNHPAPGLYQHLAPALDSQSSRGAQEQPSQLQQYPSVGSHSSGQQQQQQQAPMPIPPPLPTVGSGTYNHPNHHHVGSLPQSIADGRMSHGNVRPAMYDVNALMQHHSQISAPAVLVSQGPRISMIAHHLNMGANGNPNTNASANGNNGNAPAPFGKPPGHPHLPHSHSQSMVDAVGNIMPLPPMPHQPGHMPQQQHPPFNGPAMAHGSSGPLCNGLPPGMIPMGPGPHPPHLPQPLFHPHPHQHHMQQQQQQLHGPQAVLARLGVNQLPPMPKLSAGGAAPDSAVADVALFKPSSHLQHPQHQHQQMHLQQQQQQHGVMLHAHPSLPGRGNGPAIDVSSGRLRVPQGDPALGRTSSGLGMPPNPHGPSSIPDGSMPAHVTGARRGRVDSSEYGSGMVPQEAMPMSAMPSFQGMPYDRTSWVPGTAGGQRPMSVSMPGAAPGGSVSGVGAPLQPAPGGSMDINAMAALHVSGSSNSMQDGNGSLGAMPPGPWQPHGMPAFNCASAPGPNGGAPGYCPPNNLRSIRTQGSSSARLSATGEGMGLPQMPMQQQLQQQPSYRGSPRAQGPNTTPRGRRGGQSNSVLSSPTSAAAFAATVNEMGRVNSEASGNPQGSQSMQMGGRPTMSGMNDTRTSGGDTAAGSGMAVSGRAAVGGRRGGGITKRNARGRSRRRAVDDDDDDSDYEGGSSEEAGGGGDGGGGGGCGSGSDDEEYVDDDSVQFIRPVKCGVVKREITKAALRKTYHLPINEAAAALNIGVTVLKKYCRKFRVPRWPYRKLQSMAKLIDSFQRYKTAALANGDLVGAERCEVVIQKLYEYRDEVYDNPDKDIDENVKKLRQANFKIEYRQRQGQHPCQQSAQTAVSLGTGLLSVGGASGEFNLADLQPGADGDVAAAAAGVARAGAAAEGAPGPGSQA